MIDIDVAREGGLELIEYAGEIPTDAVWIDMSNPTDAAEDLGEKTLAVDVPTRDEMQEIEVSSRLYAEDGALFMTATLLASADSD